MPAPFPHRYELNLAWLKGVRGVISSPPRPDLQGGPPPEFNGPPEVWSPEHLLLASLGLCMMTTFLAIATKAKLEILDYQSRVEGMLDKTNAGLTYSAFFIHVNLKVPAPEVERGRKLLETAKKHCLISNTLKPEVRLHATVSSG